MAHLEQDGNSESIFQLIYLSSATPNLPENVLLKILEHSQSRNTARKITGLLLHSEGNIIQIMESPEAAIEALFGKIKNDPRHNQVTVVVRKHVEQRDFPNFHMGFKPLGIKQAGKEIPGFLDFIEKRQIPPEVLTRMSKHVSIFLRSYARVNRIDH